MRLRVPNPQLSDCVVSSMSIEPIPVQLPSTAFVSKADDKVSQEMTQQEAAIEFGAVMINMYLCYQD